MEVAFCSCRWPAPTATMAGDFHDATRQAFAGRKPNPGPPPSSSPHPVISKRVCRGGDARRPVLSLPTNLLWDGQSPPARCFGAGPPGLRSIRPATQSIGPTEAILCEPEAAAGSARDRAHRLHHPVRRAPSPMLSLPADRAPSSGKDWPRARDRAGFRTPRPRASDFRDAFSGLRRRAASLLASLRSAIRAGGDRRVRIRSGRMTPDSAQRSSPRGG